MQQRKALCTLWRHAAIEEVLQAAFSVGPRFARYYTTVRYKHICSSEWTHNRGSGVTCGSAPRQHNEDLEKLELEDSGAPELVVGRIIEEHVTWLSIDRQRFGKHISAEAKERKNRTSTVRQHTLLIIEVVFSAWSVQSRYEKLFSSRVSSEVWSELLEVERVQLKKSSFELVVKNWV
jgi:hypothetical protein